MVQTVEQRWLAEQEHVRAAFRRTFGQTQQRFERRITQLFRIVHQQIDFLAGQPQLHDLGKNRLHFRVSNAQPLRDLLQQEPENTEAIVYGAEILRLSAAESSTGVDWGDGLMKIAADLGISHKTVEIHRGRVMEKLQVDSVAELVRLEVLAGVGGVMGEPREQGTMGECPSGPLYQVGYGGGLQLNFQDSAFVGWFAGEGAALRTARGIGPGSTLGQLRTAYPATTVEETSLGTEFAADELYGIVTSASDEAKVQVMFAGTNCIFR